jgi:pimeloyl-ACP methyl ester carboxylesterase
MFALHPYDSAVILEGADVRLNYFVTGEGMPVTLLHGFTQSGRSWREVIAAMPPGYQWVAPDLRGHGQTKIEPGAPCSMDACLSDLEMLWDHLGVERTHLIGYSMGGRLALHVAVHRPERLRSLLTIGAHAGLDEEAREGRRLGDEALAQRIERDGLEAFVNYWSSLPLFAGLERRGPSFVAQIRAERIRRLRAQAGGLGSQRTRRDRSSRGPCRAPGKTGRFRASSRRSPGGGSGNVLGRLQHHLCLKPRRIASGAKPFLVEHSSAGDRAQHEGPASTRGLALHLARHVLRVDDRDVCVRHASSPNASRSA